MVALLIGIIAIIVLTMIVVLVVEGEFKTREKNIIASLFQKKA